MALQQVGIIWLLGDGTVLIDSTPLDQAERYGRYLIHSASHIDTWLCWQHEGKIPEGMEYDSVPRGRVALDWVAEEFSLLADRRILENQAAMKEIMERMGLPPDTRTDTDPHYRTDHVQNRDLEDEDW